MMDFRYYSHPSRDSHDFHARALVSYVERFHALLDWLTGNDNEQELLDPIYEIVHRFKHPLNFAKWRTSKKFHQQAKEFQSEWAYGNQEYDTSGADSWMNHE